jgi:hypothetical protein
LKKKLIITLVLLVNVVLVYFYIMYVLFDSLGLFFSVSKLGSFESIMLSILPFIVLFILNFLVINMVNNQKRALFISGIIVVFSFFVTIIIIITILVNQANQSAKNRLNQYPTLIEIDKNRKSLDNKFIFDYSRSYNHQSRTIGIPNMYFTSFVTKDKVTKKDFEYLINWLRSIESIPFYIELRYQNNMINVIYNLDGSLSYCYPGTDDICKEIDPYQWKPIISAIKENFFSFQYGEFEDKRSNEMSNDSTLKLYFRTNKLEKDDFEILVRQINRVIIEQPNITKDIIFEIENSKTGEIIIFQVKADGKNTFSFDNAVITLCEIVEVCGNIKNNRR